MLTEDVIRQLKRPFAAREHRFVQGNPYILKEAIRERLNEVDPGWTNTPPELLGVHDNVVIVRGGLTVCGVTRFDEGTGIFSRRARTKRPARSHHSKDSSFPANRRKHTKPP